LKLEQQIIVSAKRQALWDLLMDIERVSTCYQGVEVVEPDGEGNYSGTMRIKVGPVSLRIGGTMSVQEADRQNWHALLHLEGSDRRVGAALKSGVSVQLTELSHNETELTLTSDISFMVKLGQPIIRKKANTIMQEFARNLATVAAGR